MNWLDKLKRDGQEAYEKLAICVMDSLEEQDSEFAVICGLPLVKLAQVEGANYFGYEGDWNYNIAVELAKKARDFAKKAGVPDWLEDDLAEMEETLKEMGW